MGRIAAVDYGQKRIGLALTDESESVPTPAGVLPGVASAARDARAIAEWAEEWHVKRVVVGLPLHMDGNESDQGRRSHALVRELTALGIAVELHDERLTSFQADQWLDEAEVVPHRRKGARDALAALAILQSYLASRRAEPGSP